MSSEETTVQPPPPPLERPEPEIESQTRLSWFTVLFTALAAVPVGVLWRLVGVRLLYAGTQVDIYRGLVSEIGRATWSGAMIGLGIVLADRLAPRTWSRK